MRDGGRVKAKDVPVPDGSKSATEANVAVPSAEPEKGESGSREAS